MTTDPTPLQERIERILAEHPIQPPTYAGDDPIAVKRKRTAARVVEEVHAEVRKAQAEALREAADAWHAEHGGTRPGPYNWMWDRAAEYETGDSDEHR